MIRGLTLKRQIILFLAGIIVVVAVIIVWIIIPFQRRIEIVRADIRDVEEFVERRRSAVTAARRSLNELEAVEERVSEFSKATIRPGTELALITELEALAETHGIEQNFTITPHNDRPSNALARVGDLKEYYDIQVVNYGTFDAQMAYLHALETWERYVIISDIELTKQTGGDGTLSAAQYVMRMYVSPE